MRMLFEVALHPDRRVLANGILEILSTRTSNPIFASSHLAKYLHISSLSHFHSRALRSRWMFAGEMLD